MLVGENRDSTVLVLAETKETQKITEYEGKPVGNGVVVLQEGANDCVISGMTIYNNYGTTVENTTRHQMAVFGRATRTIIVNCNIWADGNDALSLWAPEGNGMYYHADLSLRCPGVDFLCPRGWCYATRCHFYGDSRAIVWHDGRGDKSKKLVITNSHFDAASPTVLGRYHHDSQFYLLNCKLSDQILDENIAKNLPKQIKAASLTNEDQITNALYKDYSNFKRDLFEDILKNNPTDDTEHKILLFKKTQKLLDRLLFIFFAEDCGLLPPNSMVEILKQWEQKIFWMRVL